MNGRRSGLDNQSQVVSRLLNKAEEKQRQAQTSGAGRPGNAGERGRDRSGRSKATYDISTETQDRLRAVAEAEGVVISDLVEAAIAAFCTAYEAGKVDLYPLRVPTRSLKADWKLEIPYEFELFSE